MINVAIACTLYNRLFVSGLVATFNTINPSTNINLILGILILIIVLIVILLVLIIKSINDIRGLLKNTDNIVLDEKKFDKKRDDRPLTSDEKENISTNLDLINNFDKVISINSELEPFGFAYDPDNGDFYSIMYPWQRKFGYCALYDEGAPALSLIFDSEPIYFDYDGKHWLIQFWKGQYGITTGAEIGVYNTKSAELNIPGLFRGRFYHAASDDERLEMSFSLYKNGKLLSSRSGLHWWLTSFILGEFSYPEELVMHIEINFPNSSMRDAFIKGLIDTGYTNGDYSIRDNSVYLIFDTPHSRQPYTKTSFTEELMQENNRRNVEFFNKATSSFTDIIDKLYLLKQESPEYYDDILRMGRPKRLFTVYDAIKKYLD